MNKDKPYIIKRAIAYFIDLFIVVCVSYLLTEFVVNTKNNLVDSEKYVELMIQAITGTITEGEYAEYYNNIDYEITKNTVDVTIIMSAVSILYHVVFCYCRDGLTLGKQIMRIKIVSNNGKALHINNYLIRSLLINQTLLDVIGSAMIILLSKNNYIVWYNKIIDIYSWFLIITLVFMFYRNDGRGLHELLANTKVVKIKKKIEELETNEIKEVVYEELPNTIQVDSKDTYEEQEKEEKKKSKKKSKKINESPEGVSENERI